MTRECLVGWGQARGQASPLRHRVSERPGVNPVSADSPPASLCSARSSPWKWPWEALGTSRGCGEQACAAVAGWVPLWARGGRSLSQPRRAALCPALVRGHFPEFSMGRVAGEGITFSVSVTRPALPQPLHEEGCPRTSACSPSGRGGPAKVRSSLAVPPRTTLRVLQKMRRGHLGGEHALIMFCRPRGGLAWHPAVSCRELSHLACFPK